MEGKLPETAASYLELDFLDAYQKLLAADEHKVSDERIDELTKLGLIYQREAASQPYAVPVEAAIGSLYSAVNDQVRSAYERAAAIHQQLLGIHQDNARHSGTDSGGNDTIRAISRGESSWKEVITTLLGAQADVQLTLPPYFAEREQCLLDSIQLISTLALRGIEYSITFDASLLKYEAFTAALDSMDPELGTISVLPEVQTEIWCVDHAKLIIARPRNAGSAVLISEHPDLSTVVHELCRRVHTQGIWYTPRAVAGIPAITPVHKRVATLLSCGYRDEEMAATLQVSIRTVRRYIAQLLEALGATTRFQAALRAVNHGLIDPGSAERHYG